MHSDKCHHDSGMLTQLFWDLTYRCMRLVHTEKRACKRGSFSGFPQIFLAFSSFSQLFWAFSTFCSIWGFSGFPQVYKRDFTVANGKSACVSLRIHDTLVPKTNANMTFMQFLCCHWITTQDGPHIVYISWKLRAFYIHFKKEKHRNKIWTN